MHHTGALQPDHCDRRYLVWHNRLRVCMGPWKPYTRPITLWFLAIIVWDACYTGFIMPLGTAFLNRTEGSWLWINILDSIAGTLHADDSAD